jgi:hypothetical protein
MMTCEYGYPVPCGKPATFGGTVKDYPYPMASCAEHRMPMFGPNREGYAYSRQLTEQEQAGENGQYQIGNPI